ncbi:MAG: M23 family metallopeptidase [Alistipes sp.]|nr:M23 family metallopeptidase [Alistipes sp.]
MSWGALCSTLLLAAQSYIPHPAMATGFDFGSPVAFPVYLSANYGEMRGNHFHSGIDIKTQGVINKPIRAIADGEVVRIAVSPWGFGKALYLQHDNGTTSVYGHLERFDASIERYIHERQYAQKRFAVDVTPPAGMFVFKRGEQIALSGNRGSSGGPHLHLEVRETNTQRPLNLVARGMIAVKDTIAPRPLMLYYVSVDTVLGVPIHTVRQRYKVRTQGAGRYTVDGGTLKVAPVGYFALEVEEKKNETSNPMGVYAIEERVDETLNFRMTLDRIGFDVGRYCYAAALYPQARHSRNGVYRLVKLPHNALPVYGRPALEGLLRVEDAESHTVEMLIADDCENRSVLRFTVQRGLEAPTSLPTTGLPVYWDQEFNYRDQGLTLSLPRRTLYESELLQIKVRDTLPGTYSPLYEVHDAEVPVFGAMKLGIEATAVPERLRSKALLATVGRDGSRSAAGGAWEGGWIQIETRSFGRYCVVVDTIAPRIVPQFKNGENYSSRKTISFTISDNFSGIDTYTGTIDGVWALFEYDPKRAMLTHYFDDARWPTGGTHRIELVVRDGKGNRSTFKGTYLRTPAAK